MVSTGMIFQYDSVQGTGLIMLSDGEKKEFSTHEWADESSMPSVGLKISYERNGPLVKIKMVSEIEIQKKEPKEPTRQEEEVSRFTSIEEFQSCFSNKGFDVIKNTQETSNNELKMGKLTDEGMQTVSIDFNSTQPELTKNTIPLSGMDDYIEYFKDTGCRLINDLDEKGSRKATLRKYDMGDHIEIIIKCNHEKISVTKTVNGQKVNLNKS